VAGFIWVEKDFTVAFHMALARIQYHVPLLLVHA
jgi:5-hydroxyisourate hydrolase-like protein (transthyretin family)